MITFTRRAPMALPPGVTGPGYDLAAVAPGIVHIGLGGFHRAHFARYTHDLMELDAAALAWGITGSGLRASDAGLLAALTRQGGLYTLIERDAAGEQCTVIGAITDTIDAAQSSAALLDAIARPATRIVSITVSEHGYHLHGATRTLDLDSPAITADLANPRAPRSMPAIIVEAYRRRRAARQPAFTALSCDNIQHNGNVLRRAVLAFAQATDPVLADWIADHGRFPNAMVDRITPVPAPDQIATFAAHSGIDDRAALFSETFRQWVIEDDFAAGRPDWDRVGAQFVNDVAPYETMKLRLLNASHLAIAGLGTLSGYETIQRTIADPLIRRYMIRLMDAETGPTLAAVPGIDLADYQAALIERFANPAVPDTAARVNADAPVNLLLDPLRDRLAVSASIALLSLGLAAWCRRVQQAANGQDDPMAILSIRSIFGELGHEPRLVDAVRSWLDSFTRLGITGTLARAGEQGIF